MLRCITVENLFPQKFFPLAQKVKWHSVYMGFSRPKPAALLVHAQRLFNVCLSEVLIDYCKPCAQTTQQSHFLLSDCLFCLSKFSPLLSSLFISKRFLVPKCVCGVWWDFQVALHQHCCPQVCAEHIKPSYNSRGQQNNVHVNGTVGMPVPTTMRELSENRQAFSECSPRKLLNIKPSLNQVKGSPCIPFTLV